MRQDGLRCASGEWPKWEKFGRWKSRRREKEEVGELMSGGGEDGGLDGDKAKVTWEGSSEKVLQGR